VQTFSLVNRSVTSVDHICSPDGIDNTTTQNDGVLCFTSSRRYEFTVDVTVSVSGRDESNKRRSISSNYDTGRRVNCAEDIRRR